MYRTATISRKGVDETTRTAELSFASEEACERLFGLEVLECTPKAVDLTRLNSGGNLLLDHDPRNVIGVIEQARVDPDRKCRARVRFGKSARAQEVFDDVTDGIRTSASVGYVIEDMKESKRDGEPPVWRVTRWTPLEISLVAVAADAGVGVGRSAEPLTQQFRNMDTQQEQEHQQSRMTKSQREYHDQKILEWTESVKKCANTDVSDIALEHIARGSTFEQFRLAALSDGFSKEKPTPLPSLEVMNERNGNPLVHPHSIGAQIVNAKQFRELLRGGRKSVSFELEGPSPLLTRATLLTSDVGSAAQTVPIIFRNARLTVADLLAQGTTTAATVAYPREVSFTPAATVVAEAAAKPEQAFDVDPISAAVRKIAAWTKVSDELLEDAPAFASYVNSRLGFSVLRSEENQILNGDGTGANMLGILATSGIQTQAKGGDTVPDALRKGIGLVDANTDFTPTGIVMHPADFMALELLKDSEGRYLVGQIDAPTETGERVRTPSIWGLPIAISKAIPENTALVGSFRYAAQLFRRTGMLIEMTNSNEDDFKKNLTLIRAELRAALAVFAPGGFAQITGI
jgi:HK97 family phage major capsid protein